MAWDSSNFISGVGDWLATNSSDSDDSTAREIAKYYGQSSPLVTPSSPQWPSNPISLKSDDIIFGGFSESFKLARTLNIGKPLPAVWLPAAVSIVTYWTGVSFSPMPPPPGGLIGATNLVTSPGLPEPLNNDIGLAFQQEDPYLVAQELDLAILKHLSTITGTWTGTAPGTPPPPLVLPWVGII